MSPTRTRARHFVSINREQVAAIEKAVSRGMPTSDLTLELNVETRFLGPEHEIRKAVLNDTRQRNLFNTRSVATGQNNLLSTNFRLANNANH